MANAYLNEIAKVRGDAGAWHNIFCAVFFFLICAATLVLAVSGIIPADPDLKLFMRQGERCSASSAFVLGLTSCFGGYAYGTPSSGW